MKKGRTMEELKIIFTKHFNRLDGDLKQIQGFSPVMKVVISNAFRQLEEDVMEEIGDENYEGREEDF